MNPGHQVPSVKTNYVYNSLQNVVSILYPLISFSYVSRILGPAMFGKVAFASSFAGYFVLLACLGIPLYGAREIAKARATRENLNVVFSELFIINSCSTLLSALLYVVPLFFVSRIRGELLLFCLMGVNIIVNMITIDWLYQGFENYRNITLRNITLKCAALVLLFVFVKTRSDYLWYAAAGVFSTAGSAVLGMVQGARRVKFTLAGIAPLRHVKPILTLFSSTLMVSIYLYLDSIMLGFWAGDRFVGLYNAALRIDRIAVSLITAMGMVLIPRISFYLKNNMISEYKTIAEKSLHFIFFLGFPLVTGLFLLAPQVMSVLAGKGFAESVLTMRIAMPILLIIGVSNFVGLQILFPNGGEKILFQATLIAAAVDICANLWLIPLYQQNGAAVATVCAEATTLAFFIILAGKRYFTFRFFDRQSFIYLCASAAMGLVVWAITVMVSNSFAALAVAVAAGVCVYLGILRALNDALAVEILALARARVFGRIFYRSDL
jgi:O-antigen/teichoic acid export membrane protein